MMETMGMMSIKDEDLVEGTECAGAAVDSSSVVANRFGNGQIKIRP